MASARSLKLPKSSNFVYFVPYDFIQILPARGPNTYEIMYGEILFFQCQSQQRYNVKLPIGKSIFAVILPLNPFRATVANSDTGSLKSLHMTYII